MPVLSSLPALPRALLAAPLLVALSARADVATVPVGAISLAIPGPDQEGGPPVATLISLPLEAPPAWRSVASSISGSTLTDTVANWEANSFTTAAVPHLLEILSGPASGRSFPIVSHTATAVTVSHRIEGETLADIVGPDPVEFQIVPGYTLATLFGADGGGLRQGTDVSIADNVLLWSGTGWETYYPHASGNWRRPGSIQSQNNVILYPDESFFVLRREPASYNLVLTGFAPTIGKKTEIAGSGLTLAANRLPTPTTLSGLAVNALPEWRTGSGAGEADNVLVWNGTGWETYYLHTSGNWRRPGSITSYNELVIPAGFGFFVLRRGTPDSATDLYFQDLNYDLSL